VSFIINFSGWIKKRVQISTAISKKLCIIIGRNFSPYYYIILSSFTVNYTISLLILPHYQKQNTKSKTVIPHSPDAMGRMASEEKPLKRLYRGFEIFKESYGIRGCVLEGKDKDSLYIETP
jgi:hypothetical protein